jgi:hypothetical protein
MVSQSQQANEAAERERKRMAYRNHMIWAPCSITNCVELTNGTRIAGS